MLTPFSIAVGSRPAARDAVIYNFLDLKAVEQRLLAFQNRYEEIAKPFKWKFAKDDLNRILSELSDYDDLQIDQLAA